MPVGPPMSGGRFAAPLHPDATAKLQSYSLYLAHGFVIHLFLAWPSMRFCLQANTAGFLLVWGLALAVVALFHHAVERPAIHLGRRFAGPRHGVVVGLAR